MKSCRTKKGQIVGCYTKLQLKYANGTMKCVKCRKSQKSKRSLEKKRQREHVQVIPKREL